MSSRNDITGAMPTPGIRKFQKSSLVRCIEKPWRLYHIQRSLGTEFSSQTQSLRSPGNGCPAAMANTYPSPAVRDTNGGLGGAFNGSPGSAGVVLIICRPVPYT